MISDEELKSIRAEFALDKYEWLMAVAGDQHVAAPLSAVKTLHKLCDEAERLNARIKELEAASIPKLEQSWADYSKSAADWWRVVVTPELQREIDDAWAAIQAKAKSEADDQWDECLDEGISPTMTVIDDGA